MQSRRQQVLQDVKDFSFESFYFDLTRFASSLDANDKEILEERAEAISAVYKKLTTKDVHLDFKHEQVFYSIKK